MDLLVRRIGAAFASIKLRVTLAAIAAMALGVSLTAALLVRQAEHDTIAAQRERELAEAVASAKQLSARVVERQRALGASAVQFDASMLADASRLQNLLENKPLLRGLFTEVFIAAADGQLRAWADANGVRTPGGNIGDREYFRRTLAERRSLVSEPIVSRMSSEPMVVFTQPLADANGVFGVLAGTIRLDGRELFGETVDTGDDEFEAITIVTDARGRMLTRLHGRQPMGLLSAEPRLGEAFAQWQASGAPVEPGGLVLHQSGEVVSAAGVAGADWVVWHAMPQSALLAPLHEARRQSLAWAAAIVAALALLMLATISWLLRPLAQLAHRAQHLFDGSHEIHEGWPSASGEIERLSRVLRHVGAERAQLESFNAEVMRKLGSVMNAAPIGIAFTRADRFELVSAELCRLLGRAESDLLGQPAQIVFSSNEDWLALGPQLATAFATDQTYAGEWQMLGGEGKRFWAKLRARPVDENDQAAGTIWSMVDISEQVAAREQLEWSATHDVLTGLANRKLFTQRLERVFDARPRSLPAEVVMIDLDHFKPINDRFGHAAGDAMLKAVAAAITSRLRATDLVARLGGDEFALLLERCPHDTALRIAANVRDAIAAISLHWEGQTLRLGASLGVASLAADTEGIDAWLAQADAACYAAKAAGRGSVQAAQRPALRAV